MTHTTINDGDTGLAVRTVLNEELGELLVTKKYDCISVADITARDAISADYLVAGKLVYVIADNTVYEWSGAAWSATSLAVNDISAQYYDFDTTPTVTMQEGRMAWDADDGTVQIGMPGGNVNLQLGQEQHIRAKNDEESAMANGSVVYCYDASGQKPTIKLATAATHDIAIKTIGVTTEAISDGHFGYVTTFGIVRDLNTLGMTEGGLIWLSDTPGAFTQTRPTQPSTGVCLGIVLYAHGTEGKIFVKPTLVPNLSNLSDVLISSPAEGDLIYWDDVVKVWKARPAYFGDVTGGNYSSFESDGTLVFNGNATVYKDLIMPAANLRPGNTPPTWAAFVDSIYGYRFDAGVADELHGAVELQHDYKEGTDLVLHLHWSPTTTNTGNIVWGYAYTIADNGSAIPSQSAGTATPTAAPGIINQHIRQNIVTISGSGLKIGAILAFRVYRQNGGTDTFTGNAFLHSIGVHYTCDTVGSRTITAK